MPQIVSVYISGSGTHAVQCNVSEQELTAVRAASADRPRLVRSFNPSRVNEELRDFLSENEFDDLPLHVSVPSNLGFLRQLRLPFTEEEQIRETAPYELEEYIQTVSIEQTQVDISIQGLTGNGSRLMAGAIEKEILEDLIQAVSTGGLEGISIQFDNVACFNLLTMQGQFEEETSGWVVYLNGLNASIILVDSKLPAEAREFQILPGNTTAGSNEAVETDENESRQESSEEDSAEQEENTVPEVEPVDYVNRLIREMEKTLLSSGLVSSPDRLFLLGSPPEFISTNQVGHLLSTQFQLEHPFGELLGPEDEIDYEQELGEPVNVEGTLQDDDDPDETGEIPPTEGVDDPGETGPDVAPDIDGEEVVVLSEEEPPEIEDESEPVPDPVEDLDVEIPGDDTGEDVSGEKGSSENNSETGSSNSPGMEEKEKANAEDPFGADTDTEQRVEEALAEAVTEDSPVEDYITSYEFHWKCNEKQDRYPVPLGAAPMNAARVPCPIDFRKGEYAHKKLWDTVKYSVAIFAFALLIASVSYLLIKKEDRDRNQRIYQKYLTVQQEEFKKVYPEKKVKYKTRVPAHLQELVEEEREKIGKGLPLKTSALQFWLKVFENIHVRGDIVFKSFNIRLEERGGGEIMVTGETADSNLAIRLKNQINNVEGIGSPRESRITPIDNQKSRYQFSFPIIRQTEK